MELGARIFIAGADSMIGASILRNLDCEGYSDIIGTVDQPDLTNAAEVGEFFRCERPEYVFFVAGKSGGIVANIKSPATLMLDNLVTTCNVIDNAYRYGAKRLLYLASSCCYPRLCPQPMSTESLMTGQLEITNEAYATAKLAGIKLCQAYHDQYGVDYMSAIPASAYGPGDDFGLEDSHVIAALIRKMHEAKTLGASSVEIWGSGLPRREFIFVDDLARACVFTMSHYEGGAPINLGVGWDVSIRKLAELIREVVGYEGVLTFDTSKPDGMASKLLDSSVFAEMGWVPKTSLWSGLEATYAWYLQTIRSLSHG